MSTVNEYELIGLASRAIQLRTEENNNRIFYLLRKLANLDHLSNSQLVFVSKHAISVHLKANDVLFKSNDPIKDWFVLITGSLLIEGALFYPFRCIGEPGPSHQEEFRKCECFVIEATDLLQIPIIGTTREAMLPRQLSVVTDIITPTSPNSSRVTLWPSLSGDSSNSDVSGSLHSASTSTSQWGSLSIHPQTTLPGAGSGGGGPSSAQVEDQLSASSGVDVECRSLSSNIAHSSEFSLDSAVMESLMKSPNSRTASEIISIAESMKNLSAFSSMDIKRVEQLCSKGMLSVVPEVSQCVYSDTEQMVEWCVLLKGSLELQQCKFSPDGLSTIILNAGDSFGVKPSMDAQYHDGVMKTIQEDCRFLCVPQLDYTNIVRGGDDNSTIVEEQGRVVLVREVMCDASSGLKRDVIMKATPEKLIEELIAEENPLDPFYVEDFIITHRLFLPEGSLPVLNLLLRWFSSSVSDSSGIVTSPSRFFKRLSTSPNPMSAQSVTHRIINVIIKWSAMHFHEFENSIALLTVIYRFAELLEDHSMTNDLYRLYEACSHSSKPRHITIHRTDRTMSLGLYLVGGTLPSPSKAGTVSSSLRNEGIFVSRLEPGSLAEEVGIRVGDEVVEVNTRTCHSMPQSLLLELINQSLHLVLLVKSNLAGFYRMQHPDMFPISSSSSSSSRHTTRLSSQLSVPDNVPPQNHPTIAVSGRSLSVTGQGNSVSRSPPVQHRLSDCTSTEKSSLTSTSLKRLMMKKKSGSLSESSFDKQISRSRSAQNSPSRSPNRSHVTENLPSFSYTFNENVSPSDAAPHQPIPIEIVSVDDCGGCRGAGSGHPSTGAGSPTSTHPAFNIASSVDGVLRVYYRDQTDSSDHTSLSPSIYLVVHSGTTANEVVMLSLCQLGFTYARSSDYLLCEVSLEEPGPLVKTRVLKSETYNLVTSLKFNCRYYLKNRHQSGSLVSDADVQDLITNQNIHFLDLSVEDIASHLFCECYVELCHFRPEALLRAVLSGRLNNVPPSSVGGKPSDLKVTAMLQSGRYQSEDSLGGEESATIDPSSVDDDAVDRFLALSNRYLYWVVTEICSEKSTPSKRAKIIKRFIRIAKLCRDLSNIEGFFAIINGLESGPVKRLKSSWEKVPHRDIKVLKQLGALLDLTGNMRLLRGLHHAPPPLIPMASLVTKDLAVLHESLPTMTGEEKQLVHFNKLRMMSARCRNLLRYSCSVGFLPVTPPAPGESVEVEDSQFYNYAFSIVKERLKEQVGSTSTSANCEEPGLSSSLGRTSGEWWKQSAANLMSHMTHSTATMRLRRRSQASISVAGSSGGGTASCNPRRLWEEQQRARRVRHYLSLIRPIQNEILLRQLSLSCEPSSCTTVDSAGATSNDELLHRRNKSFDGLTGSRIEPLTASDTRKISQILANAAASRAAGVPPCPLSPSSNSSKSHGSFTSSKKLRSTSTANQPNLLKLFSSDNRSFDHGVQRESRLSPTIQSVSSSSSRPAVTLRRQSSLVGSCSTKNGNGSSCSSRDSGFPSDSPRQPQIERQGQWPSTKPNETPKEKASVVEYVAKL